jgi:hypothetical protein
MFYCKSIKLTNYLIANGSKLVKVTKNPNDERFLVFVFKQDDTICPNLEKWKIERDDFVY